METKLGEGATTQNSTFMDDIDVEGLLSEDSSAADTEDPTSQAITPSELKFLEENGFIMSLPAEVSTTTFCILTTKLFSTLKQNRIIQSSTPSATVFFNNLKNATISSTLTIPLSTDSAAALEWCGYRARTASTIYQNWLDSGSQCPCNLLSFACDHLSLLSSTRFQGRYTREQQLDRLGLNLQTIDALLDKRYRDICGTQSLAFWVEDTLRANYHALEQKIRALKAYVAAASKDKVIANGEKVTFDRICGNYLLPRDHIKFQDPAPVLEDHVMLWTGRSPYSSRDENFTWREFVGEGGKINMNFLESPKVRGDFNKHGSAYYFTPEKETAEKFRQYAAHRCPRAETWLIGFQASKKFVKRLTHTNLRYGDKFKDYVWHCRNTCGAFMSVRHKAISEKQLITGPICTTTSHYMWKTREACGKSRLGDCNLVYLGEKKVEERISTTGERSGFTNERKQATQWAFINQWGKSGGRRLEHEIRGKIHIEITSAF